jgi:mannose-6-phosphate isomerase-like protein (cupin superfamily)
MAVSEHMTPTAVSVGAVTVTYLLEDPASAYAILSWDAPPGTPSPPVHLHHLTEEGFYVVRGTYRFLLGEEIVECGPGRHVHVRPGVSHTFWNAGDVAALALIILTPPAFAAYFRELSAGLLNSTDEDAPMSVRRALSQRFDIEVVGRPITP